MAPISTNHWKNDTKYNELLNYIIEQTENVESPMGIHSLARDFKEKSGAAQPINCLRHRVKKIRTVIHRIEHIDVNTKVKVLFALSAPVDAVFLKNLRKDALVKVDKKTRITHYEANDGSLELRGGHSVLEKLGLKRSHHSLISNYLKNKNDLNAGPKNDEKKEMRHLIEFITEKCDTADTPLNIRQLVRDFNNHFGISRSFYCIYKRVKSYCHEIQKTQFLDTHSKVKQLFYMSATLDSDFLKELRKDAGVEVDGLNRITTYTANNGGLTLYGDHSLSAKHNNKDEESEKEDEYSEYDSDEYSSEESDSECDSDEEHIYPNKPDNHVEISNKTDDFDNENPVRDRSPTEISIDDNLDFDTTTEMGEDQENDPGTTGNTSIKTRYGRLSKRRHLDTDFSYDLTSSRSSGASINTDSASSKPAKQKKMNIDKEQALNSSSQSRRSSKSIKRSSRNSLFSTFSTESEENKENQDAPRAEENPPDYHGPRIQELKDYDYNPREDNTPESSPIDNRIQESKSSVAKEHNTNIEEQHTDKRADVAAPEPEPVEETLTHQNNKNTSPETNGKEVISQEVPVKVENEEPILVEDHPEDVKPVTAHNPKIKFFEAIKSLVLFLDTPSLSNLQTKIHQKIQKMKGSKEVLQNNELIPALELLVARMTNHSVIDISKGVKSVSLIQFFCYLKASILLWKMIGLEGLVENITGLIEKSQNKRIPMEKVANALRTTLDFDRF